jgi:hypothetical protein
VPKKTVIEVVQKIQELLDTNQAQLGEDLIDI